jgi:hypothetical protein
MEPRCSHCDAPDTALLRVVLIGEILRANEHVLGLLADVMQQCGLLPLTDTAEEPTPIQARPPRGTLHRLPR